MTVIIKKANNGEEHQVECNNWQSYCNELQTYKTTICMG